MNSTKPITEADREALARAGRVTEVCREWVVREDGALAYRLQDQEINQHYQGNRFRNAVVREDFPRALDEQIREQRLAEQAAAVYHQMLAEQEEVDQRYARKVAEDLERERERKKTNGLTRDSLPPPAGSRTIDESYSPRRQGQPFPLPNHNQNSPINPDSPSRPDNYLYLEPYQGLPNINQLELEDMQEINEREKQEQKDAELARKLQEEEDCSEESILNRDRMLAIEAQDKELAKLLQEKERQKIKRAKERARQKALAKKQQEQEKHQIMPDDSYSNPADLLPTPEYKYYPQPSFSGALPTAVAETNRIDPVDEDFNYSLPVNVLASKSNQNSPQKKSGESPRKPINETPPRPTQLDLKSPNRPAKRTEDDTLSSPHRNIAMAIDPTYNRRSQYSSTSTPLFESSSTVTTSTSSSSPGIVLPTPDLEDLEDNDGPVPPYMPIQGQRRTASLEKKQKKKAKEGCKQQ